MVERERPKLSLSLRSQGAVAQLGERLLCTQEVSGSIPLGSTILDTVCCFVTIDKSDALALPYHCSLNSRSLTMYIMLT